MFAKTDEKSCHWHTFFLAMAIGACIFLPFVIWDKGYFFFTGDFNVQQIPFYKLAHAAIRSGDIFWNWNTDLGANFIGSYSFYLLTSPFFWLTIPFPNDWVPFFIAPLLVLKMACASLTSYFFLQRFVKNKRYALVGALLYAFSGFSIYNIFFNHFHEVIVFFPLLLIAMEELVQNNRRGFFAVAVAVNALINYWFFIGEVFFVILYFFIRMTDREHFPVTWKTFGLVAFESILGLMGSAFIFLPSVLAILGNPRTTMDHLLNGWNFWVYWQERRPVEILYSLFFPPDLTYDSFLFTDQAAKWSSLNAWLPLFSASGVIAYLQSRKRTWLSKLLFACLFIALVPGLNSLFILFNNSYYARWFYMPILMMSLATIVSLEDRETDWERGIFWTFIPTLLFIVAAGLTPTHTDSGWTIGLVSRYDRYAIVAVLAMLSLLLITLLINRYRDNEHRFQKYLTVTLSAVIVLSGSTFLTIGKVMHSPKSDWMVEIALKGKDRLSLPQEGFVRSDLYQAMDNLGMYWGLPNIQAFHSIVPVSIMEFYPEMGVKRDVSSKPNTEYYALRALLSVKWLFIEESKQEQSPMPGFTYYDTQNTFHIYENENFIPMGFAYDYYITPEIFDNLSNSQRSQMLLKAIHLSEEDALANSDILADIGPLYRQNGVALSEDGVFQDAEERRQQSADFFSKDNRGFTASINLPSENLVFFSVPYDKGWSATVNGERVPILKANIGFMAVRCPEGVSEIRFDYMTPGLIPGAILSAAALLVLLGYLLFSRKQKAFPEAGKVVDNLYSLDSSEEEIDEGPGQYISPMLYDDDDPDKPSFVSEQTGDPTPAAAFSPEKDPPISSASRETKKEFDLEPLDSEEPEKQEDKE